MFFQKIKKALRTKKTKTGQPTAERIEEVLSFCKKNELETVLKAFQTEAMMDILNFLRYSSAIEVMDTGKPKTYGEFHQDLVFLIKGINAYLKIKKEKKKN